MPRYACEWIRNESNEAVFLTRLSCLDSVACVVYTIKQTRIKLAFYKNNNLFELK